MLSRGRRKAQRIVVAIPAVREFGAADFVDDGFYHTAEVCPCTTVGHLPIKFTYPRNYRGEHHRCPAGNPTADLPLRFSSGGMFNQKEAWPEKAAIPQYHWRQHREGTPGAVFIAAAIPLNSDGYNHDAAADMKPFAGINPMLAVVV